MKKRSTRGTGRTATKEGQRSRSRRVEEAGVRVIGIDLGDRQSHYCTLDAAGTVIERGRVVTTPQGFREAFGGRDRARIAMEVGTHSPWVSRLLKDLGHEVLVANARKVALVFKSRHKRDEVDCESLARLARLDPKLLGAIEHRSQPIAEDLAMLRSRDVLVRARTKLINHARGAVKSAGARLKKSSAEAFAKHATGQVPDSIQHALSPVLSTIELLTRQIRDLDDRVAELGETRYPETELLRQVDGVGPLVSLAYVLTLHRPERFKNSRAVGAYLGLVPARCQSGKSDPQLRITKEGDGFLRRLLVQASQRMLGRFGTDSDLRRFGLALSATGGKNAKKRAVVAVARKLAVLLHHLWRTGEVYEPMKTANTILPIAPATVAA